MKDASHHASSLSISGIFMPIAFINPRSLAARACTSSFTTNSELVSFIRCFQLAHTTLGYNARTNFRIDSSFVGNSEKS